MLKYIKKKSEHIFRGLKKIQALEFFLFMFRRKRLNCGCGRHLKLMLQRSDYWILKTETGFRKSSLSEYDYQ